MIYVPLSLSLAHVLFFLPPHLKVLAPGAELEQHEAPQVVDQVVWEPVRLGVLRRVEGASQTIRCASAAAEVGLRSKCMAC